jgi:hypothetical protein
MRETIFGRDGAHPILPDSALHAVWAMPLRRGVPRLYPWARALFPVQFRTKNLTFGRARMS